MMMMIVITSNVNFCGTRAHRLTVDMERVVCTLAAVELRTKAIGVGCGVLRCVRE